MGGAARWFKGLFGTKKRLASGDGSDKGGYCNLPADTICLRPFLTDKEKEQNKNAIAVATAAATAAEAAVSVAKTTAEMIKLTGEGRAGDIITREELWATVSIQNVFRGSLVNFHIFKTVYLKFCFNGLARKALRALKGIVKLQALVRGYLVRKRTAEMLHSIQALIRVQTAVRSKRNRCHKKEYNMSQRRHSFTLCVFSVSVIDRIDELAYEERHQTIVEIGDMFKRRPKPKQTHNVVAMFEYEDGFVNRGSDLELNFLSKEKWKSGTAQNTPRLSSSSKFATTPRLTSSSHHHTANNNRYYVTQSPGKSVCENAESGYGMDTPGPGYMENTQSFTAKSLRSHSPPHRLSERNRLSLDEVIASKKRGSGSGSGESLLQQRYSCSSYLI
ncbi:hypothetical protein Bca52824_011032 [Brassica carinata]|uniref:DUF4005 domain-containing protein n=1 Tax=Brassica carinata TaxID=52824 RepID=A0A8X7WCR8_BRACI|nr:hypothetical protein Bca52824_011032 [Brassica carinata]